MIDKPYYRIYRPFINDNSLDNHKYILEKDYCDDRENLIRIYKLFEKELINIFNYVEPTDENLNTYSLNLYQLLVKICIEVENNFKSIILSNNYNLIMPKKAKDDPTKFSNWECNLNMKIYFYLNKFLKLNEYKVQLLYGSFSDQICPYEDWNQTDEYKSLNWYSKYNDLKHNRSKYLKNANLQNAIEALAGLFILLNAEFYDYSCFSYYHGINTFGFFNNLKDQFNSMPIFNIISEPVWSNEEKYDFDWNILKNTNNRFQKLIIK